MFLLYGEIKQCSIFSLLLEAVEESLCSAEIFILKLKVKSHLANKLHVIDQKTRANKKENRNGHLVHSSSLTMANIHKFIRL